MLGTILLYYGMLTRWVIKHSAGSGFHNLSRIVCCSPTCEQINRGGGATSISTNPLKPAFYSNLFSNSCFGCSVQLWWRSNSKRLSSAIDSLWKWSVFVMGAKLTNQKFKARNCCRPEERRGQLCPGAIQPIAGWEGGEVHSEVGKNGGAAADLPARGSLAGSIWWATPWKWLL